MTNPTETRPSPARRLVRFLSTSLLTIVFAAGIVGLMLVLAGYFEPKTKQPDASKGHASASPKPEGPEAVVKSIRLPRMETAVGTIRAVNEAIVASKILARVLDVRVKAGQDVKQGDVLVTLDKADLKSRIDQALAAEKAAKAKYDQAVIDQGRAERLRSRESITQSELDQANTALTTAKAELDRAQRTVEEARIFESYATIVAPISGRVVDKRVNAGDTVSPGQPLLSMYDPSHMQLVASVRETLALRLKPGQEIQARIDALGYECNATISEVVPEAQAESRSFQVKVTGPCPPNIYSGMFGRILIPLDEEEVLIVPEAAVRRVGQLNEVDVVEEGAVVSRRVVRLGRTLAEGREVLAGLKAGERVLLERPAPSVSGRK